MTGAPMLWPTSTILSVPASARTASTARAKRSIENLPSLGAPLWPCPGRSSVSTRYFLASAGTCDAHDEESHVQPWTSTSVVLPLPADAEWILRPSTVAADPVEAKSTSAARIDIHRIGDLPLAIRV